MSRADRAFRNAEPRLGGPNEWPAPDMSLVGSERSAPPLFPGAEVFGATWGPWIFDAAEAKGAPRDYVAATLVSVVGSLLGNARWVAPWADWSEPPLLWVMLIGAPSAGKSPALDAVLGPLREVERGLRQEAERERARWAVQKLAADEVAKDWEAAVKDAAKNSQPPPPRPKAADIDPEPWVPHLALNDVTVERLAVVLQHQPRGVVVYRDELAGWLGNMSRYSNGGSDRPFWLEAYGGRAYVVERMGRPAVRVERLAVATFGGIQPDPLSRLLLRVDDDGLLARFIPIWPEPAPLRRPLRTIDQGLARDAFARLYGLPMPFDDEKDVRRPWFVPFEEAARVVLDEVRGEARRLETETEGLLQSLTGKMPGLVVRLALVLAYLDWSVDPAAPEPDAVTADHAGRAAQFVLDYVLPMARRAYADAAVPAEERGARALARMIFDERLTEFTIRDVQRRKRDGLRKAAAIREAVDVLVAAGWVTYDPQATATKPRQLYRVNPRVWSGS